MDIGALQLTLRRFAAELLQVADQTSSITLHEGPGARTHVLVDWENVQPNEAECRALVPEATDVWLFHGPNQRNVGKGYATFGDRVTEVRIARAGKNALDFHLSFYLGYLAAKNPDARVVVLSNDKGYGPMLDHAKALGFVASQSGFAAAKRARGAKKAPAKKAAARASPARKKAAAPPAAKAPAPKATAKKAAAKKTAAPRKAAAPAAKTTPATKTAPAGTKKSFEQMVAMLKKTPSRPRKLARLLAYLTSRVGAASEAEAGAIVDRMVAEGKVTVDDKWNVDYRL